MWLIFSLHIQVDGLNWQCEWGAFDKILQKIKTIKYPKILKSETNPEI